MVTSNGGSDAFVLKLDNDGNFMWVKTFGGMLREYIIDLAIDDTGNIITTGIFNGEADFDPGLAIFNQTPEMYNDTFIQKLDSNGNFL